MHRSVVILLSFAIAFALLACLGGGLAGAASANVAPYIGFGIPGCLVFGVAAILRHRRLKTVALDAVLRQMHPDTFFVHVQGTSDIADEVNGWSPYANLVTPCLLGFSTNGVSVWPQARDAEPMIFAGRNDIERIDTFSTYARSSRLWGFCLRLTPRESGPGAIRLYVGSDVAYEDEAGVRQTIAQMKKALGPLSPSART